MKPAIPHPLQLKSNPIEKCRQWFVLRCGIWSSGIFNHLFLVKSKNECNGSIDKEAGMNMACDDGTNEYFTRRHDESVEWPELPTPGIKRKMHSSR
jgi:hypothetical protein